MHPHLLLADDGQLRQVVELQQVQHDLQQLLVVFLRVVALHDADQRRQPAVAFGGRGVFTVRPWVMVSFGAKPWGRGMGISWVKTDSPMPHTPAT